MRKDRRAIFIIPVLAVFFILLPAITLAAGVPVAVFPIQQFGESRNDVNLPLTARLAEHLANSGNEIVEFDTVIAFMAYNRIRTAGYLETFYIYQILSDLGAPFVLLGTVNQEQNKPEASMGITLNLVRTSDARTVWTYTGSSSISDEIRILKIGEPYSTAELESILLDNIIKQWPWQIINEAQQRGVIKIDTTVLEPGHVPFGGEIYSRVRLRDTWPAGQIPRVFFKADDQLYPAKVFADGKTFEATWVAGEKNGNFTVSLVIEWPHYGRSDTVLLGNYIVDGNPPVVDFELRGTIIADGIPTFSDRLVILPSLIIREPLSRWNFTFYYDNDIPSSKIAGTNKLPERLIWKGSTMTGDGIYTAVLEVWDIAGNSASVSKEVAFMQKSLEKVEISLIRSDKNIIVDLQHGGKVPLSYWRLEMWTKEGKILSLTEGNEFPARVPIELPDSYKGQKIEGVLTYQDAFGKKVQRKIRELPKLEKQVEAAEKDPAGISETWVDEF